MAEWQNNILITVRTALIGSAAVKATVGTRSYLGELAALSAPKFPLVTFKLVPVTGFLGFHSGSMRVWAWGTSISEVSTVYSAVETLLDNQLFQNASKNLNLVLNSLSDDVDVYDPEQKLYSRSGTFTFRATQS